MRINIHPRILSIHTAFPCPGLHPHTIPPTPLEPLTPPTPAGSKCPPSPILSVVISSWKTSNKRQICWIFYISYIHKLTNIVTAKETHCRAKTGGGEGGHRSWLIWKVFFEILLDIHVHFKAITSTCFKDLFSQSSVLKNPILRVFNEIVGFWLNI